MEPPSAKPAQSTMILEFLRVLLEYIKVLIWPLILVVAFNLYSAQIFEIISSREIDAFGLKIGSQIDDINTNYQTEIEKLKEEIKKGNSSDDLLQKLARIETNLGKELTQVKTSAMTRTNETSLSQLNKREQVAQLEKLGFEAIQRRDVEDALHWFDEARALWPDYHNISEIWNLLFKNKSELSNPENIRAWKNVTLTILEKYSWGMPVSVRNEFRTFIR